MVATNVNIFIIFTRFRKAFEKRSADLLLPPPLLPFFFLPFFAILLRSFSLAEKRVPFLRVFSFDLPWLFFYH